MALRLNFICVLVCLLAPIAAFAPHAPAALTLTHRRASAVHVHPAALAPTRPHASAVPAHAVAFAESMATHAARAFERTLQPATVRWLTTTQAVLSLFILAKSAFGVEVQIADLFSFEKVFLRLSVGSCSVFFNKMLNMGKTGAFVVAQVVLAAFVLCAGSNLPVIFTWHAVFERACVYTTALYVPALLKQAKRVAARVGVYVRTLRKYLSPCRTFA